jgi:hypothetical protein
MYKIRFGKRDDLCFVLEISKRSREDDAVIIYFKTTTGRVLFSAESLLIVAVAAK